jgi:hypothetical protein
MATATATPPRLRPALVQELAGAEAKYNAAKLALEEAQDERDQVRARCKRFLPLGQIVKAGGYAIERIRVSTGRRFGLKDYLAAHELTDEMQPFVGKAGSYDKYKLTPIK